MDMEYEIKIRLKSVPDLSRYRFLGEVYEEDTYYNHPCRDFARTDEALRIRKREGDVNDVLITYKGPRVDSLVKAREEIELRIDDFESMDTLLKRLGFKPVAIIRKHRKAYYVDGAYVTIDEVEGLGTFMEIEAEDEQTVLKVYESIKPDGEIEKRTYLELYLLHYGRTLGNVDDEVNERNEAYDSRE